MKVYTAEEMRRHEQMAVDKGTSFAQLMENAGSAAASDILRRFPQHGSTLIVCGKGNNGGDGLVIARILQAAGWQIDIVFLLGLKLSELAEANRQKLLKLPGISFLNLNACLNKSYTLIIDGIFGTGFSGTLPTEIAAACRTLNNMSGSKIALDIPTGLNGDTGAADNNTFRADITYTFAAYKPAHTQVGSKTYCGEIICLDIGIE
ncbi:MAG: NAD(P)H-hydrate epimerase [Neisseria sp.]|uniref:NAD(P)H-hydrate epimerase n=1 Tax=Neisseria sp. TaxID=192066 RepID=UPI0026DBBC5E|nr:NAD(P)H-hydrate epimerase [Neisseria sp.]MDO4640092.1 NAD(P)H-hydrate epimerase [Neisseria sp.]